MTEEQQKQREQKTKKTWSAEDETLLICYYQSFPELWTKSTLSARDPDLNKLLCRIEPQMERKGFDKNDIIEKIRYLRKKYKEAVKKTLNDEEYKPTKLRWFEQVDSFMRSDIINEIYDEAGSGSSDANIKTENKTERNNVSQENSKEKSDTAKSSVSEEETDCSGLQGSKQSMKRDLEASTSACSNSTKGEDEFDTTGRNVAFKLRKMDPGQQVLADKFINDILFYGQSKKLQDITLFHKV